MFLDFTKTKKHIMAIWSRQTGKSTACGKRNSKHLLKYIGCTMLIIAPAQRQSSGLYEKTKSWLEIEHQKALKKGGGWVANAKYSVKKNME